jgi:hypothetical protein
MLYVVVVSLLELQIAMLWLGPSAAFIPRLHPQWPCRDQELTVLPGHSGTVHPALRIDCVILWTVTSTVAPVRVHFSFPKMGCNVVRFLQKVVMFFLILTPCRLIDANVSEKHTVSICRAEDGDSMFETLPSSYESTRRQNPKEHHDYPDCRENLKLLQSDS